MTLELLLAFQYNFQPWVWHYSYRCPFTIICYIVFTNFIPYYQYLFYHPLIISLEYYKPP